MLGSSEEGGTETMEAASQNGESHPLTASDEPPLRIGCALLPKKVSRYLTKRMFEVAAARGMHLCTIDHTQPLELQGHFDAIIHKLPPNAAWAAALESYSIANPHVKIIDSVDKIRHLHNRSTMLRPFSADGLLIKAQNWSDREHPEPAAVRVGAPLQVELLEGTTAEEAKAMLAAAGLAPPLLVKPVWTDGREGSHGLAVLHDMASLDRLLEGQVSEDLTLPLVVQKFVDHGGVMFKVYVLGNQTVVTKRPSLGESHLGEEAQAKGVLSLPRISCRSKDRLVKNAPAYRISSGSSCRTGPGAALDRGSSGVIGTGSSPGFTTNTHPDLPPEWFTHALAGELRESLGLELFNFDLIRTDSCAVLSRSASRGCSGSSIVDESATLTSSSSSGTPADAEDPHYYVIDINYFPGVDKIPTFENIFVEFLATACREKRESCGRSESPAQ